MITVTLTYDSDDDRSDIIARVIEALRQHGDAAYELVQVSTIEPPGDTVTMRATDAVATRYEEQMLRGFDG